MKSLAPGASLIAILGVAYVLSGCYATHYVSLEPRRFPSDTLRVAQMNDRLATSWLDVHPKAGPDLKAQFIRCAVDSCWFLGQDGRSPFSLPSKSLHSLEYRDHAWGAVGGLFGGAAAGFAASGVIGGAFNRLHGWDALVWFTGGFLGGALGGAVYGGLTGTSSKYRFVVDSTSLERPSAGEGVGAGTVVDSQ